MSLLYVAHVPLCYLTVGGTFDFWLIYVLRPFPSTALDRLDEINCTANRTVIMTFHEPIHHAVFMEDVST
jgi:hypothetical protein